MSEAATLTRPQVFLAKIGQRHWPQLPGIEETGPGPLRDPGDSLAAFQSGGTDGVVAEINGRVVGFALCKVAPVTDGINLGGIKKLLRCCWPWKPNVLAPLQNVELLRIIVLCERQRQGIGRALLEQLHLEYRRICHRIQAMVPERNLAAQLFLKDSGYRAVRIVPGRYGSEDGYLMERQCS
jgi:ribosomal protein S18 acetylase RimI-like enzyme